MAPRDIEEDTLLIVQCLFDDDEVLDRCGQIETDGSMSDDDFDPVIIADKLRQLADEYNDEKMEPLIKALHQATANQAVQVFGEAVETLCLASSQPELSSELQLLRASVALGRYVKNNSPQLKSKVAGAMATFLNTRVVGWVRDQGGWVQVTNA
ncbi:bcl-2-like protein 15 [Osmerus mordax]|uniref:bcl-2-like protein 15 n=1 Tax=Osmerus mordax TaxID=8014 RepID=UPI00350EA3D3